MWLPKRFKNNKPLALTLADSALYNLTAVVRGIGKSVIDDRIPALLSARLSVLCSVSSPASFTIVKGLKQIFESSFFIIEANRES